VEALAAAQLIAANPRWYHRIEVAPGVVTPGLIDLRPVAPRVLPADLAGKRALDVGTFDGFWAFELERRGAETVAIDVGAEDQAEWPPLARERLRAEAATMGLTLGQGFALASEALGSRARRVVCPVYDLDPSRVGGPVDVAFCGALLLHLRDPVRALERIHATLAPGGTLVLLEPVAVRETLLAPRRPVARFHAHASSFNWWIANVAALRAWARAAGFASSRVTGFYRPEASEGLGIRHAALRIQKALG
jgi:SAM-dependent methyltransferase